MTIKAQPQREWWPMEVAARVREVVPSSVTVTAQEDAMRGILEVWLSEPWWRRRRLRLGNRRRGVILARACSLLADAPVGLIVRVGWR